MPDVVPFVALEGSTFADAVLASFQVLPPSIEISTTPPSMSTERRVEKRYDQRCLNESEKVVSSIVNFGDVSR